MIIVYVMFDLYRCVLLVFLLLCPVVAPHCRPKMLLDKLILTKTQKMQIPYYDYIQGFNITYSLTENTLPSVQLHDTKQTISSTLIPCSELIDPQILITAEDLDHRTWKQETIVVMGNDTSLCFSLGESDLNHSITFVRRDLFQDMSIASCLTASKIEVSKWLVVCQNKTDQLFFIYENGIIKTYTFPHETAISKAAIYKQSGKTRIIALHTSFLSLISFDDIDGPQEVLRISDGYLGYSPQNLTDFILGEKLVVTDAVQGCFKMTLKNDLLTSIENVTISDSTTLKIAAIGSTYFILLTKEIMEVVWLDKFSVLNVYQIDEEMQDIKSLTANQQLIIIQTTSFDYIYKRGVTEITNLFQKTPRASVHTSLLSPIFNILMEVDRQNITLIEIGEGFLSFENLTKNMQFDLIAKSRNGTEEECRMHIILEMCDDLNNIYEDAEKFEDEQHVLANTSLEISIGDCFYGLNLTYSATNSKELVYTFNTQQPLKFYSAYADIQVIDLIPNNLGIGFFKVTLENNTFYVEICIEYNLMCLPISHKNINETINKIQVFTYSQEKHLITYTLLNDPYTIYFQSLNGTKFPPLHLPGNDRYHAIGGYTISTEYIFVLYPDLNVIDMYKLDFKMYEYAQTINSTILEGRLFKPKQIRVDPTSFKNLYIRCSNLVAIVEYNSGLKLLSIVEANITGLDDWDSWRFEFSSRILVLLYSSLNTISEYSIIQPHRPRFLKNLPLLDLTLMHPIVSYLSSSGSLVVSTTDNSTNQLTIFKVGKPAIESLFSSIVIDQPEEVVNIKGLDQQDLLLMYQNTSYHMYTQKVHQSVSLTLTTSISMLQFITSLPLQIQISTPKETRVVKSVLKVINYEERVSAFSTNPVPINLPRSAELNLSFDKSNWYKGPITKMELIQNVEWQNKIKLVHQFDKQLGSKDINDYYDILDSGTSLWVLTSNQTIDILDYNLKPIRPKIPGIPPNCYKLVKDSEVVFLFCSKENGTQFIKPILLDLNNVYFPQPQIPYSQKYTPQHILKVGIIKKRLIILDNNIFGSGVGVLLIFRFSIEKTPLRSVTLTEERRISPQSFMLPKSSTINDYEIFYMHDDLYHIYVTVNTFGLVSGIVKFDSDTLIGWTEIDLLNDPPEYMFKYQFEGNEVLQVRVIDSYKMKSHPLQEEYYHIVVITTLYGAHLELELSYLYDIENSTVTFLNSTFIQAFNTYYNQTRLNWLVAPPFNPQRENMFLTAYLNNTIYKITVVAYPLVTARSASPVSTFPIFKEGVMQACNVPVDIVSVIFAKDNAVFFGWAPICNDVFQIKEHALFLYKLSNNISLLFDYKSPPEKLNELRFQAINDYNTAAYVLEVKFDEVDEMKWWAILLICSTVVLVVMIVFCTIRQLRIFKEKQERDEFLDSLIIEDVSGMENTSKETPKTDPKNSSADSEFIDVTLEEFNRDGSGNDFSIDVDDTREDSL